MAQCVCHWLLALSAVILAVFSFFPGLNHFGVCELGPVRFPWGRGPRGTPRPRSDVMLSLDDLPASPSLGRGRTHHGRGNSREICPQCSQGEGGPVGALHSRGSVVRVQNGQGVPAELAQELSSSGKTSQESCFCYFNSVYITNKQAIMGKPFYQYPVSMIWRLRAAGFQHKHKMLGRAFLCNLIL